LHARPPWRYALVVAAFALGLMSKPMLVTLPFVLVLLDVWPLGRLAGLPGPPRSQAGPQGAATVAAGTVPLTLARSLARLIGEKWPLFALAAAYAEAGRFPEAVRACKRAIELAQADRQPREAERYAQQLVSYRAGRPFHFGE
jgi:hypothetical protein